LRYAGRAIALVLAADAAVFVGAPLLGGGWSLQTSLQTSLPLDLCDVALVVAALACWTPSADLPVELTYFWGLAGTLQAVVTPDLGADFPRLEFFQFVVAHIGIVTAALFLVVGLRRRPRPGSVRRVFAISAAYTAFVGGFDWLTGANYMYLARLPGHVSLLSFLGPWPWYVVNATGVALALLLLLDTPFRRARAKTAALTA
jgi:hypothetical integral membrane protein (TIGR02206 family)